MKYLVLILICIPNVVLNETTGNLADTWVVKLRENGQNPNDVAKQTGFISLGEAVQGTRIFVFRIKNLLDIQRAEIQLEQHDNVISAEREAEQEIESMGLLFNDPEFPNAWHLEPNLENDVTMNITGAWSQGFTGKGIKVVHLDTGLDYLHPDLFDAYDPTVSYDFVDDDPDPFPSGINASSHGTNMAGLVAAKANNSVCSVGVAYDSKVGMRRVFNSSKGSVSDGILARVLNFENTTVDVVVYGFSKTTSSVSASIVSGPLEFLGMKLNAENGRQGRGIVSVHPGGNDAILGGRCSLDYRSNNLYGMTFNAVGERGTLPRYGERCTAVIASTFSSGNYPDRYMVTPTIGGKCIKDFTGTSASTAIAGGLSALVLQANPNLGWRDVQHLFIRSADHRNLDPNARVEKNGVGRVYSRAFGYGLVNAGRLVDLAQKWNNVPKQLTCSITFNETREIRSLQAHRSRIRIDRSKCLEEIKFLEHVQVAVSASSRKRGNIELTLTSPMGTRSKILTERRYDFSILGLNPKFRFLSMQFWDENPTGIWELRISNANVNMQFKSPIMFKGWTIILYGTRNNPNPL